MIDIIQVRLWARYSSGNVLVLFVHLSFSYFTITSNLRFSLPVISEQARTVYHHSVVISVKDIISPFSPCGFQLLFYGFFYPLNTQSVFWSFTRSSTLVLSLSVLLVLEARWLWTPSQQRLAYIRLQCFLYLLHLSDFPAKFSPCISIC